MKKVPLYLVKESKKDAIQDLYAKRNYKSEKFRKYLPEKWSRKTNDKVKEQKEF